MVMPESEMISHDEVESPLQSEQQFKPNHGFSTLGRQSSIYSLTLDEFQHTLCESGKNFGSMNMDEFLTSIWTAEENQTAPTVAPVQFPVGGSLEKQPSLARQGSLTLPAPLCRKTVEEVWSEIHKGQQGQDRNNENSNGSSHNPESAPSQPTFGEMTLEDFLIKAGVVREQGVSLPQQQFGMYQNTSQALGSSYMNRGIMGISTSGAGAGPGPGGIANYQTGGAVIGDSSGFAGNGKRSGGYGSQPAAVCYVGRVVNGGGGYGPGVAATPVSPVSPEGVCDGNQFGLRGRKRMLDGPVEKVVERRQRRMIKNRESAARSRARKQAYTVELEAELNQLREENVHLKQALAELERKRKQQYFEETKNVQTKAQKAKEKLRGMRRCLSWPL